MQNTFRTTYRIMVESMNEKEQKAMIAIMYSILFANDMCMCYLFDTLNEIEQSAFYHFKIKMLVGKLRKEMRKYNKLLEDSTKKIEFIADVNDVFNEAISNDVWKLENVTFNYLNRCHVPNAHLMSKISVCDILCQTACCNLDLCCESKDFKKFTRNFRFLRLTKVEEIYKKLYKKIDQINSKNTDTICDLNQPVEIENGFNIIVRKIQNYELIFDILNKIDN